MATHSLPSRSAGALSKSKPKLLGKSFDWLMSPQNHELTSFQKFTLGIDWTKSLLGPISSWPVQLRQIVLMIVADPSPAVVYWGRESTAVYNEAYTTLIGQKHPGLQGQDPKIEFAEIWSYFEDLLTTQRATGCVKIEDDQFLLLQRYGYFEETFFSWKFVPIFDNEGVVVGSYATVTESSRTVITERRLSTIHSLNREMVLASSVKGVWHHAIKGLENAATDVPLAILYSVSDFKIADSRQRDPSTKSPLLLPEEMHCVLEGLIGVPEDCERIPKRFQLADQDGLWSASFQSARESHAPVLLDVNDGTWDPANFEGLSWRGFDAPSSQLVICPMYSSYAQETVAFLVIALNPRKRYDEDHRNFIHLLTQQISTPLVVLQEEAWKRQLAAQQEAHVREKLSSQLCNATQENKESQMKFDNFANRAQVGLAISDLAGGLIYANELWHNLTMLPTNTTQLAWDKCIIEEDYGHAHKMLDSILKGGEPVSFSARVRTPWKTPDFDDLGQPIYTNTHLLCSLHPDNDANGKIRTVMSCLTDISELKWTEAQLRTRMDQAILMKQQHEKFIDMTSHEMRNPLSAILGSADMILTSLKPYAQPSNEEAQNDTQKYSEKLVLHNAYLPQALLHETLDAADTIVYCAMHQKRIVDDILTLSRMQADLLQIIPEPTQPISLIQNALKMFETELRRADVKLDLKVEPSLQNLQVDWVMLDPSRILQVLINLLTNAIKFTRTQSIRQITVTISVALFQPTKSDYKIKFVPKSNSCRDHTLTTEWGDEEVIFLAVSVKDTGCGMSDEESKSLFKLFQQASPKTQVRYGGSGLGLFISRQLVEMQGGEIGVQSEAGTGSEFMFYVKSRRTLGPVDGSQIEAETVPLRVPGDALREACSISEPSFAPVAASMHASIATGKGTVQTASSSTLTVVAAESLHILVVEDKLVNQTVVSKQLRLHGCTVHVANHGREALDFLGKSEWWHGITGGEMLSIVLMDLEMPVMDGMTAVQKIRNFQKLGQINGHIPIIAVTANARKDQILEARNAGMDDVTTKPYRIGEILAQIRALVGRYDRPGLRLSREEALGLVN